MGAWDAKVSDIYSELEDWLNVRGGAVSDPILSLINRARESIWQYKPWDYLVKTQTLTLINNSASLPADFGRILQVGYDSNGDGILDWHFHRNDSRQDRSYRIDASFSVTAGYSFTIIFPQTPSNTLLMRYVIDIGKCTEQTHYLGFPANLIMRKAQLIHVIDNNQKDSETQRIKDDYEEEMRDFIQAHLYNDCAMDTLQQDLYFNQIANEEYSLNGDMQNHFLNRNNSYDY